MVESDPLSTMPIHPQTCNTESPANDPPRHPASGGVRRALLWLTVPALLALASLGSRADPATPEVGSGDGGGEMVEDPREVELERIRQEIGRLQHRLVDVRRQESGLEDELERVELELDLQQAELDEATAALELAEARTTSAEVKMGELEVALDSMRGDLQRA